MAHAFGTYYLASCQAFLKIFELLFCIAAAVLCSFHGLSVTLLISEILRVEILLGACAAGGLASLLLFILYATNWGLKCEHCLAFQIYFHLAWFVFLAAVGSLFLYGVLKTYSGEDIMYGEAPKVPHHPGDRPVDLQTDLKDCHADMQADHDARHYRAVCYITWVKFGREAIIAYKLAPDLLLLVGGIMTLCASIVYLMDFCHCIAVDKAPLKCSCEGDDYW